MSSALKKRLDFRTAGAVAIVVTVALLLALFLIRDSVSGLSGGASAVRTGAAETGAESGNLADANPRAESFDFYDRQSAAKADGKYLLAYFFNERDEHQWDEFIGSAQREWPGKIEMTRVRMDATEAAPLVKKYGLRTSPSMLVFAPNGAVTAGFVQRPPSMQKMSAAMVSEGMAEVISSIQSGKFTFLAIGDAQDETYRENAEVALAAARTLDGMANVVSVEPRKDDASDLVKALGLEESDQKAHVYVVSPAGGVVTHLEGKVTEEDLFDSFANVLAQKKGCGAQTVTGGSSCEPGKGVAGSRGCGAKGGGTP